MSRRCQWYAACSCVDVPHAYVKLRRTRVGTPRITQNWAMCITCSTTGPAPGYSTAQAGACGNYIGKDSSNYSAVIVPTIRRAAAGENNPDFAGDCGRYLHILPACCIKTEYCYGNLLLLSKSGITSCKLQCNCSVRGSCVSAAWSVCC